MQIKSSARGIRLIEVAIIGGASFLFYHWSSPHPPDWYKHFVYLAQAWLDGRLDLRGVPGFYQDLVPAGGKIYMPFPPLPAVLMLPSVALWGTAASQVMVSKVVGAINVGLMWLVLGKLKINKNLRWLLTIFFGFGTGHWYAAVWGTTWFFAHIVGVMLMLIALVLFFYDKSPLLTGLSVGAAVLSRHPMIGGAAFFIVMWLNQWRRLIWFGLGLGLMLAVQLGYNWARFGHIFEEGYVTIAEQYRQGNYPYTILLKIWPSAPRFGYMDIRNVPLHLYTMLLMPPEITLQPFKVQPSPYGMSLILTSPLLLWLIGKSYRNKGLWQASWLAMGATSIPIMLHFTQGWVQFGYRFMLDFIPFVMIILALRLRKISVPVILLTLVSMGVNWWGIWWGKRLGW